jgi:hypothetical protein
MERGYDYAGGCRFMDGGSYSGRWSRYFLSRGGGLLANLLLGTRMRDMTGGFECFTREALQAVIANGVHSRAHFFQTEIKLLMHEWNWTEVPIHYRNPSKSVGRSSVLDAIANLWRLIRDRGALTPTARRPLPAVSSRPVADAPGTRLVGVLTTIQPPTACVEQLRHALADADAELIVVGDLKGPSSFELPGVDFIPLSRQRELPYRLSRILPTGHYARKNLGYLLAVERGAECIYETDDDNAPNETWAPRNVTAHAQPATPRVWMNVYRAFTSENIWPRGLPLHCIADPACGAHDTRTPESEFRAPIQQGLADHSPDVDAVWRLVFDRPFAFNRGPSLWLPPGTWCPFNSQSTWWWPEAYPLLYLPSHCSFRMTDIWRSFIAQRCLWELGYGIVFHAPEVTQERNVHNLTRDFKDEVPGYIQNDAIVAMLSGLTLAPGRGAVAANLVRCYEALAAEGVFPSEELTLVCAWIDDLQTAADRRTFAIARQRRKTEELHDEPRKQRSGKQLTAVAR